MPKQLRAAFAAALCLTSIASFAQKNPAADRLRAARARYYTPTENGLSSFHCNLSIDWKEVLTRSSKKPVADNAPYLVYLKSIRLSVSDDLHGAGALEWIEPSPPPADESEGEAKIRGGMKQMIGGFFQTWNSYMNGSMVPAADPAYKITPDGDGFRLHAVSDQVSLDEHFDKNNILDTAHVVTPAVDVISYPSFSSTPDGLVVNSVHSTIKQPPTAAPVEVTMSTTYARVANFQLPAALHFEVQNVAAFDFSLSGCTVNPKP